MNNAAGHKKVHAVNDLKFKKKQNLTKTSIVGHFQRFSVVEALVCSQSSQPPEIKYVVR